MHSELKGSTTSEQFVPVYSAVQSVLPSPDTTFRDRSDSSQPSNGLHVESTDLRRITTSEAAQSENSPMGMTRQPLKTPTALGAMDQSHITTPASSLQRHDPLSGAFNYQDSSELVELARVESTPSISKKSTKLLDKVADNGEEEKVEFSTDSLDGNEEVVINTSGPDDDDEDQIARPPETTN